MKTKEYKETSNRSVFNKLHKRFNAREDFAPWKSYHNHKRKWYGECMFTKYNKRSPSWKLASKNKKQWEYMPKKYDSWEIMDWWCKTLKI